MTDKAKSKEHWLWNRKNILAAIVFCTTSLPIGVWTVYEHFEERRQKSLVENRRFSVSIAVIDKVYDSLRKIVHKTDAHRALLLRAEDSGDIPVPGKDIYSSIVYEVFNASVASYKPNWRRQLLDGSYITMLSNVSQDGYVNIHVDKMKPGILKDVYESSGVAQTHVYSIHSEPAYFFYCSIVFRKSEPLSVAEKNIIRAAINDIRELFRINRAHLEAFKI